MSTPDTNEGQVMMNVMVNVFDSDGNRVTTDLKPGDYSLVMEMKNLAAAVRDQASHATLVLNLQIDKGENIHKEKSVPISDGEDNLELPFSIDKWMTQIYAIAFIFISDESNRMSASPILELRRNVTSTYPSST